MHNECKLFSQWPAAREVKYVLEMTGARSVDVVVLGGGPAGSTAAAFLAQAGIEAVVVEGERFPRFHVGESLLPHTIPLFDRLGVHEKVKALGHTRRKEGATFVTHDGSFEAVYWFDEALPPALPYAYQVRRDELDACLLDHARGMGVEVLEGYRADDPIWEGDRLVGLRARDPNGEERLFRCKLLLDASGQHAFLARKMRWRRTYDGHHKVAAVSHFRGVKLAEGRESGNITIALLDRGWFWLIPFRDDTVSVGAVLDVERWRDVSGGAEGLFQAALARAPEVARRLAGAERLIPFNAVQNFSFEVERIAGDGFCLIGDAAGFLDPIFSTGVFIATTTAERAALLATAALRSKGRVDGADMAEAATLARSLQKTFFSLIQAYYDPHFLAFFLQPRNHFHMQSALTSLLAADVIGPDRWVSLSRFRMLQGLAKVQRWMAPFGKSLVRPLPATPA